LVLEAYGMNPPGAKGEPQALRSPLAGGLPWYVGRALEARRGHAARSHRRGALVVLIALVPATLVACDTGDRHDKNEPSGNFRVAVVRAAFPAKQKLAKQSNLVITIRNTGGKAVPNLAVTVNGFETREIAPDLADPERPTFAVNGRPVRIGGLPESQEEVPAACVTAYVNTWACGKLAPGKQRTFKWTVTAVKAGPYRVTYSVAGGLDGKAKAVDANGTRPTGTFAGTISDAAPQVRIGADGKTVVGG
jgi:hypothetical protein